MTELMVTADLEQWLHAFARLVERDTQLLTELDAAIGDADHGANMRRGVMAAVAAIADADLDPGGLCKKVGMTLVSTVGGASGPLYGTFFLRLGNSLVGVDAIRIEDFAAGLRAGLDGVVARGKAEPGDKTMFDAIAPAVDALDAAVAAGQSWATALHSAAAAAAAGRDATVPMLARKGRASYLGERSIGHQDPGATSSALLFGAADIALGTHQAAALSHGREDPGQ